jgi:hypothetical protein
VYFREVFGEFVLRQRRISPCGAPAPQGEGFGKVNDHCGYRL